MHAINSIFWYGIEPESMWIIDLPTNDNRDPRLTRGW